VIWRNWSAICWALEMPKIIGLVVGNVAAAAEDAANLVFGFGTCVR